MTTLVAAPVNDRVSPQLATLGSGLTRTQRGVMVDQTGHAPTIEHPAMSDPLGFAQVVAELALTYADEQNPDRLPLVEQIVAGAVATIPGVIAAAVETMNRQGQLAAPVQLGDDVARAVMDAQNQLQQGPTFDAFRDDKQVLVTDLTTDGRWPDLAAAASGVGVKAALCTPMHVNGRTLGVLVLLGGDIDFGDPDEDSEGMARVFAVHAALALSGAATATSMLAALSSRDLIGQAKGILMERFHLSADAAFAVLVRTSSHTNTKLRAVCEKLCDTGILPPVPPQARTRSNGTH